MGFDLDRAWTVLASGSAGVLAAQQIDRGDASVAGALALCILAMALLAGSEDWWR